MHKVHKKIKSFLLLTGTMLFFLVPLSLKAAECRVVFDTMDTSSLTTKEMERQIQSYLKSHSCSPILTDAPISYRITDISEERGVVYTFGLLSQEQNCLFAFFSIESGWFSTTTELVYMAIDLPLPDKRLFQDVICAAQVALPKSLSPFHVFIQPLKEAPTDEGHWQMWIFYNQSEWVYVNVLTRPTPDGGTDFVVQLPQNQK